MAEKRTGSWLGFDQRLHFRAQKPTLLGKSVADARNDHWAALVSLALETITDDVSFLGCFLFLLSFFAKIVVQKSAEPFTFDDQFFCGAALRVLGEGDAIVQSLVVGHLRWHFVNVRGGSARYIR